MMDGERGGRATKWSQTEAGPAPPEVALPQDLSLMTVRLFCSSTCNLSKGTRGLKGES